MNVALARFCQRATTSCTACPLPTQGGWHPDFGHPLCQNPRCTTLADEWRGQPFAAWEAQVAQECAECRKERERRNRLLSPQDPEVQEPRFLDAPYVHQNNEPKYHALLLRAYEYAKRHEKHCLWFKAHDTICNKAEIPKDPAKLRAKKERFLQFHDQKTKGIHGLNWLYEGMEVWVTDKIRKGKITILKHTPCEVVGWELHTADRIVGQGCER